IDADLNAGLIDDQEAKTRRLEIGRESDFYGAMDGASKFVRGDAIAAIIITLTNIIGGLLIGTLQHNMKLADAAATFTILTIGDGLVSIIPALIISTSAGLIVSRAAGDMNMGQEFARQFSLQPRAIGLTALVVFLLGLVPGLPTLPFLVLSGGVGTLAFFLYRAQREQEHVQTLRRAAEAAKAPAVTAEAVEALLPLDAIELEVGYGLIPLVDDEQNGDLLERIRSIRQQFALDTGLLVPPLHVRDNLQLKPGGYVIRVKGVEVAAAELMVDYLLAMDPGDAKKRIEGIPTHEPAFNLPALWIPFEKREEAQFAGYSVVDLATVIATHLTEVIRAHADELLGRQETQRLLENLAKTHPKVVEEVQALLSLGAVQKVLQNLLRERISIRDLLSIGETMADYAPLTKDPDLLTEYVRQRLARAILQSLPLEGDTLPVLTVDQNVEDLIQGGVQQTEHGSYLTLEPHKVQAVLDAVFREAEKMMEQNMTPTIVTSPVIRRHLRRLIERQMPTLTVLSHNELVTGLRIKSVGLVSVARG
ncbi:MAG: flagellar biosynthesis protein FlhA, partial [Proteobacteria bacterium]|nr:flagellar biosynthesis protein FlhA [Pseudomonadota bacterium]